MKPFPLMMRAFRTFLTPVLHLSTVQLRKKRIKDILKFVGILGRVSSLIDLLDWRKSARLIGVIHKTRLSMAREYRHVTLGGQLTFV